MLDQARKGLPCDSLELSYYIWDTKERWERFQKFQTVINQDKLLPNQPSQWGLSRMDNYLLYSQKMKRLLELFPVDEVKEFAALCFMENLVGSLHYEMFLPTLKNLGAPEQIKKFYDPAYKFDIVGCYAQTELAHGSDVNRIETTATFDPKTQEFIINTPTLGATKWWGSDLGLTTNYAVTQCQLISNGKNHGVQNFIIPIRDLKTHQPLKGVEVGDIGPKFGFNTKDNGYLKFYNYRIPVDHMLSKYVKVGPDGTVTKTGDDKIWHATMQLMRQHFLEIGYGSLGMALTVGIRYSLQRTQFKDSNGKEIPIFDYQLQQHKLVQLIPIMYGTIIGSKRIKKMAKENVEKVNQNDFSLMMEIHLVLSAAKAFYTWGCYFGVETVRQALGGHGYSLYSGIPQTLTEMSLICTAEGDNTVLALSVGKLLLAYLNKAVKTGKAPNQSCDYLEDIFTYTSEIKLNLKSKEDLKNINTLREILRYNVAFNVALAGQRLTQLMGEGKSFKTATDYHMGMQLMEMTRAQSNYFTMKVFVEELNKMSPSLKKTLEPVCILFGILKLIETETTLFEFGILQGDQFRWAKDVRDEMIQHISGYALGLVESLGYQDSQLKTALGKKDGKIYETLYDWASKENPINDPAFTSQVFQSIKQYRGHVTEPKL